jgi:hypothetical protein
MTVIWCNLERAWGSMKQRLAGIFFSVVLDMNEFNKPNNQKKKNNSNNKRDNNYNNSYDNSNYNDNRSSNEGLRPRNASLT